MATKHSALPHSPVERHVENSRVAKLVAILQHGEALPFQWADVEYQGSIMRMNGQHSSAAILQVGADLPETLSFHLDHFAADDREGIVDLFRQFDQRWSGRSAADISGAFQGLIPEIVDCNRKLMKVAAEAISWFRRQVEGMENIPTGDDTYQLLHQPAYVPFYLWLNGINNGRRELFKKEVVAAMYATYDASQSGATTFWREVSYGPDFFSDDMQPGAVLIGELSRAMEEREFREKEFIQTALYFKKSIKAWNAFCAGQRISSLKVTKGKGCPVPSRPGDMEDAA
jgi:hypothetical protein